MALVLFIGPALMVVFGAFRTNAFGDTGWTLEHFALVFSRSETYVALGETLRLGITITAISTAIAIVFAALTSRTDVPFRGIIPLMMAFVLATPGLFYAISWSSLGSPSGGTINQVLVSLFGADAAIINTQSWWGLVLVSVSKSVAIQFFLLIGPFIAMDRSLEEAARVHGASPFRTFFTVQIPVLLPAISGAAVLSLIVFLEAFDIPLILGVPAGIYVLPTEIYSYLQGSATPNYGGASVLAVLLMATLAVLVYVQRRLLGNRSFATVTGKSRGREVWPLRRWRVPAAISVIAYALVVVILPLVELVALSMRPYAGAVTDYSLDNFLRILNDSQLMGVLVDTVLIGLVGGAAATIVAAWMLWTKALRRGFKSNFINLALWIVIGLPGLVLALGVLWYFLNVPGLAAFYSTPVIIGFGLFIMTVPIATRALEGGMAQLHLELQEAAWVAGRTRLGGFRTVVVPNVFPSLLSSWLLCFVLIVGNLSLLILLSSPGASTASVEIFEMYNSGRSPEAAALFVLLFIVMLAVVLFMAGGRKIAMRYARPAKSASVHPSRNSKLNSTSPSESERTESVHIS